MTKSTAKLFHFSLVALVAVSACCAACAAAGLDDGLIGYWKLQGDGRDHSGRGHHGASHGDGAEAGAFNGRDAYVEITTSTDFDFGGGDFSTTAEIFTDRGVDDVTGDLVTRFDPRLRQGFNLTFASNTSGYNSQSDMRQLFFGVDAGTMPQWIDCGRPGGIAHSSDALTVFKGELYAATSDSPDAKDWAHVFRYKGGQQWEDCGRVGDRQTRGVYAMIVHDGDIYAGTAGPHSGDKANTGDFGRVYRYRGGQEWEDIGQPGEHYRINSLASYRGKLYACAINTYGTHGGVYVYEGGHQWRQCGDFGRPHTMGVHNDRLYAAFPEGQVFEFDGQQWKNLGNPYGSYEECNQLHSHGVFGGELYVGTWPRGKVAIWRDQHWHDAGRLGDAIEVVQLMAYNGSFYAGTIPRAEVFRLETSGKWTSLGRLFNPSDYNAEAHVEDWTRASSLRVFQGKLFCSTATCYRALIEHPRPDDIRGKVFSCETGVGVSHDHDLAPGWRRLAAIRRDGAIKLFIDGRLVAEKKVDGPPHNVSSAAPLRIGFGPHSHFKGKIREVRLYNRALSEDEITKLSKES